jgi:hypothetical protein
LCIVAVVGVIDDDYLAVTRRPEDDMVEITKSFLASSSSREVLTTNEEGSSIGIFPGGVALLEHQ